MIHFVPDPHPGRCLNRRPAGMAAAVDVRCLRREGHEGRCRFPGLSPTASIVSAVYTTKEPEPWVEPTEVSP